MKSNDTTYVLMAGWARSGASLSCSIINAHPNVSFSTDVVKYINFCFKRYSNIDKQMLNHMLEEMQLRLKARFCIELDIEYCKKEIADNYSHSNIYKVLMSHLIDKDKGSKIIGEYEGVTWSKIPYILDNIENSKAMIILRDPRDVLVSFKKNTIAPANDYLVSVFNSLSLMQSWLQYEKSYPDRFFGIRFEELKQEPKQVVENICDFLEIDFMTSMLDSKNWTKLFGKDWTIWENHDSSSFVGNDKLKKDPVGRWKSLIDPVDHFICEWIAGDVMKEFGMKLEFENPTTEILDQAMERLMSSPLLKESMLNYLYYKQGSEKYPLDPCVPSNWDKNHIADTNLLNL